MLLNLLVKFCTKIWNENNMEKKIGIKHSVHNVFISPEVVRPFITIFKVHYDFLKSYLQNGKENRHSSIILIYKITFLKIIFFLIYFVFC